MSIHIYRHQADKFISCARTIFICYYVSATDEFHSDCVLNSYPHPETGIRCILTFNAKDKLAGVC